MSKREANRQGKKQQIVDAARQLMKSRNASGFSMRTLAEVAGVSVATPYSLFGSKQGVIAAVMDTEFADFRKALLAEPRDPVEIFFHAVTVTRTLFEAEPHYHRTGAETVHAEQDEALATKFSLPRQILMRDLVLHAIREGYLSHRTNADSLALALNQQFYGWIQAWARNKVSLEDMAARTEYGFALTLAAAATDNYRNQLLDRAFALQDRLPEAWQQSTSTAASAAS